MTPIEPKSILTLALMAACAGGATHGTGRAGLERLAKRMSQADGQRKSDQK